MSDAASVDQAPAPRRAGGAKLHYPAIGLAGGGAIAIMGVALGWWQYSFPLENGVATVVLKGTDDWTGVLCMLFGFLAIFAGIALLVEDTQMRTIGAALGVAVGLLVLVTGVVGLFRADAVVGIPQPLGSTLGGGEDGGLINDVAIGVYVSILGGVIATAGAALASRGKSS
ncbi:MAG: hypothetical protein WD739_06470 [Actinomycetota bacterium]